MRTMLFISVFTAAIVRGDEPKSVSMRQKLHAQIMESLPSPSSTEAPDAPAPEEISYEIVEIEPLEVVDSPVLRELAAKIESESEKRKAEQFTPIKGGTIYKKGNWEIGTWGDRAGVSLLKFYF